MLAACTTLPVTEAATALVAALVAALGTIAAKHRPAGARTRVSDQLVDQGVAAGPGDWAPDWEDEFDEATELVQAPSVRSRFRGAVGGWRSAAPRSERRQK